MDSKQLEHRLQKRLDKSGHYLRQRQKENYRLAKALGFTPIEAGVMQNWREEDIRELARSRGYPKESPLEE